MWLNKNDLVIRTIDYLRLIINQYVLEQLKLESSNVRIYTFLYDALLQISVHFKDSLSTSKFT